MYLYYGIGLVLMCCLAAPSAKAQEQTDPADTANTQSRSDQTVALEAQEFDVGAIVLDNLVALKPSDFTDILGDYAARTLGREEIGTLVNRIAARARERGYVFASAVIERQSLGAGVLKVRIEEGVIDTIRIKGSEHPAVRRQLEVLADGHPVTLNRLERNLLLAGDVAGVRLRSPRYFEDDGRRVLEVKTSHEAFAGRVELSNEGTQPVGPVRARIALDANALFSSRDAVDLTYTVTPTAPEELQRIAARYGLRFGKQGTVISLAASHSAIEPGAYLESREIVGDATRISIRMRHPLQRSQKLSVWLDSEVEWTQLRQDRAGDLARRNRVATLRTGVRSRARVAGGYGFASLTLSQGLDALGATPLGSSLSSRPDAAPDFTSLAAYVQWNRPLENGISLFLSGQGLVASGPLPITEDFGLGGTRFLRGYNFNERSGDRGIAGLVELRYDWETDLALIRDLQFYAFADGGVVGNLDGGRGGGSLASGGGGVRTALAKGFDVEVLLALPLTGPRFDSGDTSGRLLFNIGHAF